MRNLFKCLILGMMLVGVWAWDVLNGIGTGSHFMSNTIFLNRIL